VDDDPLDGTKNFKNGGKGYAVMIGLCQNGKPILGVIYAPAMDMLIYAQKEKVPISEQMERIKITCK